MGSSLATIEKEVERERVAALEQANSTSKPESLL
jgi:hypothetical protein